MASVNRSALVPFSAEEMYSLVDNIEAYEEFLPWCNSSIEHNRTDAIVEASIGIAKGSVQKAFRTRNTLHKHSVIEMELVDGPFKHLHGFWRFDELKAGEACKVSLDLDYEFSNKIISLAIGPVFNQVANTLVDSFVDRAKQCYG
jgi:ribosome-associated toxin RatA of RatAB toxin-antitoxin module